MRPRSSFGARLLFAVVVTLLVVGGAGDLLLARQFRASQIADYARAQNADVRSFAAIGRDTGAIRPALARIDQLLDAIAQRPGTLETLLINPASVVVASGNDPSVEGRHDTDARIANALRGGANYAGLEADPRRDTRDFEFVASVDLPGGRYALEVSYDHRVLDANLDGVRRTLALIGLLALVGGTAVFYLVGGRMLLRSHRIALERATRDGLTDLPNHRAFQDEFSRAVSSATRYQEPLALILFDVDDFKHLNDRHGHPHGDGVLGRVAEVLRGGRVEDRPYRIGGDEFALLLPHTDEEGARAIAGRLDRAFSAAGTPVSLGVSHRREGKTADDLRGEADAALYEAKRRGGGRVAHFDDISDRVVITTSARTALVRRIIDEDALSMVFQPIWDLATERLLGLEALMRPDAEYGLSGPAEAFDLAEQIGRVHDLDVLCAGKALRALPDLPDGAHVFINLSPQTLALDADCDDDWLLDAVAQVDVAPDQVVIEITERFGARTASVIDCLQRLRRHGFKIALDDVGTGNSGLEMLRKISPDFVKIDRSIVVGATTDRNARAVLMAMATYARQTGAYVIAEGIEDLDTLAFLEAVDEREVRPDRIIQGGQGFGLGRPAPSTTIRTMPHMTHHVPS